MRLLNKLKKHVRKMKSLEKPKKPEIDKPNTKAPFFEVNRSLVADINRKKAAKSKKKKLKKKKSRSLLLKSKVSSKDKSPEIDFAQISDDDFDESTEQFLTTGKSEINTKDSRELMKGLAAIFKEEGMAKLVNNPKESMKYACPEKNLSTTPVGTSSKSTRSGVDSSRMSSIDINRESPAKPKKGKQSCLLLKKKKKKGKLKEKSNGIEDKPVEALKQPDALKPKKRSIDDDDQEVTKPVRKKRKKLKGTKKANKDGKKKANNTENEGKKKTEKTDIESIEERLAELQKVKDHFKELISRPKIEKTKVLDLETFTYKFVETAELKKKKPKGKQKVIHTKHLAGSKFRWLNSRLYEASTPEEAKAVFEEDKQNFEDYHIGFRSQVASWPVKPVVEVIRVMRERLDKDDSPMVIADMGCGEPKIAEELASSTVTVHSFDLVAINELVTVCDISKTPLDSGSVDIVVFCLALMNKNFVSFLYEANRILKKEGQLIVVEVTSRTGDAFTELLNRLGFEKVEHTFPSKFFVMFTAIKGRDAKKKNLPSYLTTCLKPIKHKRR